VRLAGSDDDPIHFDIDAAKYKPDETVEKTLRRDSPTVSLMAGEGLSRQTLGAQRLTGKIFRADGVTPALGAKLLYFEAHETTPSFVAMADALGTVQSRGFWRPLGARSSPTQPMAVVFLPGTAGAAIKLLPRPPDGPLRITLPAPIAVSGRVLVGGVAPSGRRGTIEVLAQWQGEDFLKPYLNVKTTAEADGNFYLGGMTPGDYVIQAALDSIWLSPTGDCSCGPRTTRADPAEDCATGRSRAVGTAGRLRGSCAGRRGNDPTPRPICFLVAARMGLRFRGKNLYSNIGGWRPRGANRGRCKGHPRQGSTSAGRPRSSFC
jgi:hypothetical protein